MCVRFRSTVVFKRFGAAFPRQQPMEIRLLRGTHALLTKLQLFEKSCNVQVVCAAAHVYLSHSVHATSLHTASVSHVESFERGRPAGRAKDRSTGAKRHERKRAKRPPAAGWKVWVQWRKNVRNQPARTNLPRALKCGLWNRTSATQSFVCARRIHSEMHSPSSIPRRARCPKAQSASPMFPTRWDLSRDDVPFSLPRACTTPTSCLMMFSMFDGPGAVITTVVDACVGHLGKRGFGHNHSKTCARAVHS